MMLNASVTRTSQKKRLGLSYVYSPLEVNRNTGETSTRLLRLHPGSEQDELLGEIFQRHKNEAYEALSYCWGTGIKESELCGINVLVEGRCRRLGITSNLEAALKKLRMASEDRVLWIDAVCINQEDNDEKSRQIPKMNHIYAEAKNVCIWLGEATAEDKLAVDLVQNVLDFASISDLLHPQCWAQWAALVSFLKKDWFSRRWIIQEIGFAREAIVYCGQYSLDWSDLTSAVALLRVERDRVDKLFELAIGSQHDRNFLGCFESLYACRLMETLENVFRRNQRDRRPEALMSLEALISSFCFFNASNPNDVVYAVLSFAKQVTSEAFIPCRPSPGMGRGSLAKPANRATSEKSGEKVMLDSISRVWKEAVVQLEQLGFKDRLIEDARCAIEDQIGFFNQVEKARLGGQSQEWPMSKLSVTQRAFWDEESRYWVLQGQKGKHALIWKLLNHRRAVVPSALPRRDPFVVFPVDYRKQFLEVCIDFVGFSIKSSNSLDILCRPWAPTSKQLSKFNKDQIRLPSWVCSLSNSPLQPLHNGVFTRANADLLIGVPDSSRANYAAAAGTQPEWCFGRNDTRSLFVTGLVAGEISTCDRPAFKGVIPNSWTRLSGWENPTRSPPPESFWRTIVADRNQLGENPHPFYSRACQIVFGKTTPDNTVDTTKVICSADSKVVADFVTRVQAVTWNRRPVRIRYKTSRTTGNANPSSSDSTFQHATSTSSGKFLIGLVPREAQIGDKICILGGCSVPVVIRQTSMEEDRPEKWQPESMPLTIPGTAEQKKMRCKLIGECYVHGIMDGEVLKSHDFSPTYYIFEIQ